MPVTLEGYMKEVTWSRVCCVHGEIHKHDFKKVLSMVLCKFKQMTFK